MRSPCRKGSEVNVVRKLAQRETSRRANQTFVRSNAHEKFKGYQLCVSFLSTSPLPKHRRALAPKVGSHQKQCLLAHSYRGRESPAPPHFHSRSLHQSRGSPMTLFFLSRIDDMMLEANTEAAPEQFSPIAGRFGYTRSKGV